MNTTKVGQGMFAIALILGIAMMTMYFGGVEERRHNPNQNPESILNAESVEVHLQQNQQGHYVLTGTINDQPVEFLLDTGATDAASGVRANAGTHDKLTITTPAGFNVNLTSNTSVGDATASWIISGYTVGATAPTFASS